MRGAAKSRKTSHLRGKRAAPGVDQVHWKRLNLEVREDE